MKSIEEMESIFKENLSKGNFVCWGATCKDCPWFDWHNMSGTKCNRFPIGKTPTTLKELSSDEKD